MYITDFQVPGSLTLGNEVTKKVLVVTYPAPYALPCLESESLAVAVALAVKPSLSSGRGPHFSYMGPDFFTSELFVPLSIYLSVCPQC